MLAHCARCLYYLVVTIDQLKAELRAASPEVQEELLTMLRVLRRARDPERGRRLTARLDDPSGWVTEEEAARRLGLEN
jgi:hypothetical protein